MHRADGDHRPHQHLDHPAFIYDSLDEFLDYMVPYVVAGLAEKEPIFIAVGGELLDALRTELGPRSKSVQFAETRHWHPNSSTRLRAFYEQIGDELAAGAEHIRLVGEPAWPDGPSEMIEEWQRYESVLNRVLESFPVSLVCTYDNSQLDPSIIAGAYRTHPFIDARATRQSSSDYVSPETLLANWKVDFAEPPEKAVTFLNFLDVAAARRFVGVQAESAGLSHDRMTDFLIASTEILTNAVIHGDGPASVSVWTDNGYLICQIEDEGPGLRDPLAGYIPPERDAQGGRGLWIARQLVDLLQIKSTSHGTSVRLQLSR